MLISDATLLSMLRATGAEQFEGLDGTFLATFDRPYAGIALQEDVIESRKPVLYARVSDLDTNQVLAGTEVTRVRDGAVYSITRIEDDGEGLATIHVQTV